MTVFLVVLLVVWVSNGCHGCGGEFRQSHGILRSPVSGTKIGQVTRCDYVLLVPPDKRIKVVFIDLVLKTMCCSCTYDYIELRDGRDANATLIGRYCAQNIPKAVYSTRNQLWIRFRSDFRTSSENRFKLTFETTCGRHFTSLSGGFSSLGFPEPYRPSVECVYTIAVPQGRLKVSFESFDLEGRSTNCEFDFLEVKEIKYVELNSKTAVSRTRRYCGSDTPPTIYSTVGAFLWFRFKTDSNGQRSGFLAKYRTVSVGEGSCNRKLTSEKGFIFSKNYPFLFPKNTICSWKIEVDTSKHVFLTFDTFNFSRHVQSCKYGYLRVYDDLDLKSQIGEFCGTGLGLPHRIVSRTNVLTLRLASSNIQDTGWFSIRYESSDEGPCGDKKFTCKSHQCIEAYQRCDEKKDCNDGSDEQDCPPKEETLSWYSFWPVTVVIVMLFMGIWLWRTWRKFATPRSEIEVRYCASPCHHHSNGGVSEALEPPSYHEAISHQTHDVPPPTYEEAVNSQPIPYTSQTNMDSTNEYRQRRNEITTRVGASSASDVTLTAVQRPSLNRAPTARSESSIHTLGQPYTSHRPQDRMSEV